MKQPSEQWIIPSQYDKECFLAHFEELWKEHGYLRIEICTKPQRTRKQNSSLHLYCGFLAEELNNAGYDLRRFFEVRPNIDIDWTSDLVKKHLWKPLQKVIIDKESTTEADTTEYTKIYECLNRFTSQEFGISISWPSKDNL